MKKFLFIIELILISCLIFAIPVKSVPIKVMQPNGDSITIIQHGDEYGIWYETLDGMLLRKCQNKIK